MILELHILQNFAPANLNRDDTGSPKDCEFGGHRRLGISDDGLACDGLLPDTNDRPHALGKVDVDPGAKPDHPDALTRADRAKDAAKRVAVHAHACVTSPTGREAPANAARMSCAT